MVVVEMGIFCRDVKCLNTGRSLGNNAFRIVLNFLWFLVCPIFVSFKRVLGIFVGNEPLLYVFVHNIAVVVVKWGPRFGFSVFECFST